MVQFNLLPDVKLAFIKAQRIERLVISISAMAVGAAIVILLVMVGLVTWQKKSLSDLNKDVNTYSSQTSSTKNLNKILTVQNQLKTLPRLDMQKPQTNLIFDYLQQLTPSKVGLSDLKIDFTANSFEVSGNAPDLGTVDQFVDTLKFATYTVGSGTNSKNVFSNVVLASFQVPNQGLQATYDITSKFDPAIFSASNSDVKLNVKTRISTRSEIDAPLFTGLVNGTGSNTGTGN